MRRAVWRRSERSSGSLWLLLRTTASLPINRISKLIEPMPACEAGRSAAVDLFPRRSKTQNQRHLTQQSPVYDLMSIYEREYSRDSRAKAGFDLLAIVRTQVMLSFAIQKTVSRSAHSESHIGTTPAIVVKRLSSSLCVSQISPKLGPGSDL